MSKEMWYGSSVRMDSALLNVSFDMGTVPKD